MSLPPLIKYIYSHGTEEVILRGKKIYHAAGAQFQDIDHLLEQVRFRVRNDLYQNYYTVTVAQYLHPDKLNVRCQCPYNLGEICRHEVAALFQLHELIQSGFFEDANITYDQQHTVLRLRQVNKQMLQIYTSPEHMETAQELARKGKVSVTKNLTDAIEANVVEGKETFAVRLRQNEERYFDTSCTCGETKFPLCLHKAAVFLHVLQTLGAQHFQTMRNWDVQKNLLLRQYGYSLNDDLTGKFDFVYQNGKPFLRVLDSSIKKKEGLVATITEDSPKAAPAKELSEIPPPPLAQTVDNREMGLVLQRGLPDFPFVEFILITGKPSETAHQFLPGIERLASTATPPEFATTPPEGIITQTRQLLPHLLANYIRRTLPFADLLDTTDLLVCNPQPEVEDLAWEYLLPRYRQLLQAAHNYAYTFLLPAKKELNSKNLIATAFNHTPVFPKVLARKKSGKKYQLQLQWMVASVIYDFKEFTPLNKALLLHQAQIYAIDALASLRVASPFFPSGQIIVEDADWSEWLRKKLLPWSKDVSVEFDTSITIEEVQTPLLPELYLSERDRMLVIEPRFRYDQHVIRWGEKAAGYVAAANGLLHVHRDEAAEETFINDLRNMHTDLREHLKEHFFYLPANVVLSNDWFFRFMDEMKERDIQVYGFENLKTLRVNVNKPRTQLNISSGIDWFDAQVTIVFGDQTVSIADVKKALQQKQSYVRLGDGSLGMLPEAWIKKYSLLLKMGEAKGNRVRLKKYHFSVLDELLEELDEHQLAAELEEKKQRLEEILSNDYTTLAPPQQLKASLRPYQQAGFQWLQFLRDAGWGGILADDMGLGKTVQTLANLQHYKNLHPDAQFLVVCPTTLMYNWEAEIKKFTPTLTHQIHHGQKRAVSMRAFKGVDVIITTYGTMRSDIRIFSAHTFDYAILDESQAIKNPASQSAKAALLINAKNKLCLSGTPVQNNTFDLYAQMNFLNPGMLGSREAFMNDFATPIDKFREEEVIRQLRQLTYPFILRRTKEQVAKDLPEKTESILICEMGKEQRRIYDAFRNDYRDKILGMIDERGIEKSQMHILQGLTRLRQICDSPALIPDDEARYPNHSIKLDELIRELTENVGEHKALVFSQFLGMLALIRQKLEELQIPYTYFDGSTSSTGRETAIQRFQHDEQTRVFLISLKAGGIGLNLTAADYVYIVDPWWNPAVEQQAIDRTHRIGQTKNIFAYRLICKDSIEEKMLELQERKRLLASELVADDSAFFKRLTRDDIAYLLS